LWCFAIEASVRRGTVSYELAARPRRPGLGDVDPWEYVWAHALTTDAVYVLRLRVTGVALRDPTDALLFARAAGQGQNLALDVRGVAVSQPRGAASDEYVVDIIFTTSALRVAVLWADGAADMARKIAADPDLRARYPGVSIAGPVFGALAAPAEAIDHWRAQPVLWDHAISGPRQLGGPTDSFAQPADYNVVKGKADDGSRAVPWVIPKGGLGPPPKPMEASWMVAGGLGVVLVGVWLSRKETRR
jgi:hypothetical protein